MKKLKIEAIFRESVMYDIRRYWEASGRTFNAHEDGEMVFENVTEWGTEGGHIWIKNDKNETFIYNISDFYRFKVIE